MQDSITTAVDDPALHAPGRPAATPPQPSAGGLRRLLRRSELVFGLVTAARGLRRDLQVLGWLMSRGGTFRNYLREARVPSLHLGAGHNVLKGWLNTDIDVANDSTSYLDGTRRFPFADGSFAYVSAEHMIEHVPFEAAFGMLQECRRILKPGGRIRLATPDLTTLLGLHAAPRDAAQQRYIDWMVERQVPWVDACRDVFVINMVFRLWGHQFLYDRATMTMALTRAGFTDVRFFKPGISDDPHLRGIESHGVEIQAEDINQFETMVVEATRPGA